MAIVLFLAAVAVGWFGLEAAHRNSARRRGRPRRSLDTRVVILGSMGLVMPIMSGILLLGGRSTDAVILANDGHYSCTAEWTDPWDGHTVQGWTSCEEQQPGEIVRVRALGWPLRGQAADPWLDMFAISIVSAVALGLFTIAWVRS